MTIIATVGYDCIYKPYYYAWFLAFNILTNIMALTVITQNL
jgi:hypothetical protein